jgi:peptidyl-prolyl cis-trans isomerase SurA
MVIVEVKHVLSTKQRNVNIIPAQAGVTIIPAKVGVTVIPAKAGIQKLFLSLFPFFRGGIQRRINRKLSNTLFKRLSPGLLGCLAALCMSVTANAASQQLDRIIAIVDDDVIMESELRHRMGAIRKNLQSQNQPMPPEHELREQLIEVLIVNSLQLQMANRAGVRIGEDELNETLTNIARQNNMSLEAFREALIKEGTPYPVMREQIREEMLIKRVQRGNIARKVEVTEQEIDNYLASEEGKSRTSASYLVEHLLLPVAEDADEEIVALYTAYMKELREKLSVGDRFSVTAADPPQTPYALRGGNLGWRKAADVPAIFADIVANMEIGSITEPIRSPSGLHLVKLMDRRGGKGQLVDQTLVRHILIKPSAIRSDEQARELITELRNNILAGADFAELAKEHSEDIGSAQEGGELGWTMAGQMVPEFEKAMLETPVGEISQPLKSQFGWHILQVMDKRQEDVSAQIRRNQAHNILHSRKYEEELQIWLQKIRDEAFVDIK